MWEVSPRSGLRYALLPLSAMGFEQASVGVWPTPSRTHLCCEDVLSRRGLRLPPECECRGAVVGRRTQSSAEKDVPDPMSEARVYARRPRSREGSGGAVRSSESQWPAASDTQPHLGGGGLRVGEQSPALVAEPDPVRPVRPAEPTTAPSATA